MRKLLSRAWPIVMASVLLGCEAQTPQKPPVEAAPPETSAVEPDAAEATPAATAATVTEADLKAALKEKNPNFEGELEVGADQSGIFAVKINDGAIEDISPLAGLPLRGLDLARCHITDISALRGAPLMEVYLEDTGVKDIGPLAGAPLVKLYLSNTQVEDLGPLKNCRDLQELNLVGTKVSDLSPLQGLGIEMLWLTGCPVSDIGPLQTVRLVSVTLADTKVSDLGPLKGHPTLQRLHIAGTEVTDLSVLEWLKLTRLIFTPNRIKTGIEFARGMGSLTEIGADFEGRMPPAQFWPMYDAGEFK